MAEEVSRQEDSDLVLKKASVIVKQDSTTEHKSLVHHQDTGKRALKVRSHPPEVPLFIFV